MIKFIKGMLKEMGEGLTFAYAGEMLSKSEKTAVLDRSKTRFYTVPDSSLRRVVLAGDEELNIESLERAIRLCNEQNAMLDLLCVSSTTANPGMHLDRVLARLSSEPGLDFQITRRQGDLLAITHDYSHARPDTLLIILNISDRLHNWLMQSRKKEEWYKTSAFPVIELSGRELQA